MSSPSTARAQQDVTLTRGPAPQTAAAVATLLPSVRVTAPAQAVEHAAEAYLSPPPFLINSQFRI